VISTEIRLKAAELIEKRGWWQGDFKGPHGELCAMGALCIAAECDLDWVARHWIEYWPGDLREAIREVQSGLNDALDLWQDEPDRTKEEVIAALRGQTS
jgi:hypothetical protein